MAVVWIDTGDIETAKQLVHQLARDFGGQNVMLTAIGDEVRLKVEFESSDVVARALDAVERWLDESGAHAQVAYGSNSDRELSIASAR